MRPGFFILTDDFVNDLAANWYSLHLQFNTLSESYSNEVADGLIESGRKLKAILRAKQYTYLQPLNVYVDMDTFFDIWLDAGGDIRVSLQYHEV